MSAQIKTTACLSEPRLIEIPAFQDDRGMLSVVDWEDEVLPFVPKRFYYIHNVASRVTRGGHAHWIEAEAILALSGRFTVHTDTGMRKSAFSLDSPGVALYIPPATWHQLDSFSPGAVCAVFASERFDATDYCRDYEEFLKIWVHGS